MLGCADAVWSSPSSHGSCGGTEKIARGGQKTAGATLFPLLRRSSNFHFYYTAALCVVLAGHELVANLVGNNNFLHNYDQVECPHSSGAGFIQLLGVRGMQVEKSSPHLKRRNMAGTTFEEYYTSLTEYRKMKKLLLHCELVKMHGTMEYRSIVFCQCLAVHMQDIFGLSFASELPC